MELAAKSGCIKGRASAACRLHCRPQTKRRSRTQRDRCRRRSSTTLVSRQVLQSREWRRSHGRVEAIALPRNRHGVHSPARRGWREYGPACGGNGQRVAQELGGKSANIILADTDLKPPIGGRSRLLHKRRSELPVSHTHAHPSRAACTRHSRPRAKLSRLICAGDRSIRVHHGAAGRARRSSRKFRILFSRALMRVLRWWLAGQAVRREINRGYAVRPTVFGDVTPQMRIAREEIFGPVLSIMSYDTEDEAIDIANDTPFGLAAELRSVKDPAGRSRCREPHPGGTCLPQRCCFRLPACLRAVQAVRQ